MRFWDLIKGSPKRERVEIQRLTAVHTGNPASQKRPPRRLPPISILANQRRDFTHGFAGIENLKNNICCAFVVRVPPWQMATRRSVASGTARGHGGGGGGGEGEGGGDGTSSAFIHLKS